MQRLVVVGDSLLDQDIEGTVERMCPDAPVPVVDGLRSRSRPGGAGLAASIAASTGRPVTLITALADDQPGRRLRKLLAQAGVEVIPLQLTGATPEKIRIRSDGRTLVRLDRGGAGGVGMDVPPAALGALDGAAVLVADYGRGVTSEPSLRDALASRTASTPVVWDPHPRGARPVSGCALVSPNRDEAGLTHGASLADVARRARELAAGWDASAVAVTMGSRGALVGSAHGMPVAIPAPRVAVGDPCGAGDCFAAAAAALLADGATSIEAVQGGVVAASAFVADGGASAARLGRAQPRVLELPAEDGLAAALRVASEVRARGGRVVATGGCFDLLHAGHVASLRAARALGDCLIVCLNSDASVRSLKGPGRPLVSEADRAAVLSALSSVDAVVVFDEATPESVLRRLQPDIFAKGGDYDLAEMPEAQLVRSWGGEAVLVPYLDGRSTTNILEEVRLRVV